jgi:hypothetical protein
VPHLLQSLLLLLVFLVLVLARPCWVYVAGCMCLQKYFEGLYCCGSAITIARLLVLAAWGYTASDLCLGNSIGYKSSAAMCLYIFKQHCSVTRGIL